MRGSYTHGGSVWKSLFLLLRGIVSLAAFAGVWVSMLWWDAFVWVHLVFWISAAIVVICIIFALLTPLFRLFR